MAVSTTDTFSGPYQANGVTVEFPFTFKAVAASDVGVFVRDAGGNDTLISDVGYSVSLAAEGGTVIMSTAPATGDVYIFSEPSFLQPVSFATGQPYLPSVVNEVNDRDVARALWLRDQVERAPRIPIGGGGAAGQFPRVNLDGTWGWSVGSGIGGAATNVREYLTVDSEGQVEFDFSAVLSDAHKAAFAAAPTDPIFTAQGVPFDREDYSWNPSTLTLAVFGGARLGEVIGIQNGVSYDQGLVDGRNIIGLREGGPGKGAHLVGTKYPLATTAARALGDSLADRMPSIWDFYRPELGDTTEDWSPQLNRAAQTDHDVYVPTARMPQGYTLRAPVTQNAGGQMYYGDTTGTGEGAGSEFNILPDFPLGAAGVVIIPPNLTERGAGLSDIGFRFTQPDTAVRADLIQYPPALYARNVARMRLIGRNTVYLGWKGFDLLGNNGGLEIGHLRMGCFSKGLAIDGAYDKITVGSIELWPYGCGGVGESEGLYSIYCDGVALGLDIGRVDGFSAALIATFKQRIRLHLAEGEMAGSHGFGTIAQLHLDGTYGRLEVSGGRWAVGSWYATTAIGEDFAIRQTGGVLSLGPSSIVSGAGTLTGQPLMQVTGGKLIYFGGGQHEQVTLNAPLLRQTGGDVMWFGGDIIAADQARTAAFFHTSGGRITLKNPRFDAAGEGSGQTVLIENDDWHDVEINALLSRGRTVPAPGGSGTYKFGSTVIAPVL